MLDDIIEIVGAVGNKLDVVMLPKVEGAWDIHYLDQLLAQLEARHAIRRPILIHAILETAQGVDNVIGIATASPRMQVAGPADRRLRAMKTTRVGGGHPEYKVLADSPTNDGARASFQQDLWHYTLAKMVDACAAAGIKPFYGPFGDFSDPQACEAQFRNAFLMGCAGAWTLHPSQVPIAKRVFSPDPAEIAFAKRNPHAMPNGGGAVMIDGKMQDEPPGNRPRSSSTSRPDRRERPAAREELRSPMTGMPHNPILSPASMSKTRSAKFKIGQVVRHRLFPFRGRVRHRPRIQQYGRMVSQSIPAEARPHRISRSITCSRRTPKPSTSPMCRAKPSCPIRQGEPVRHPQVAEVFERDERVPYRPRNSMLN
jgi:citrate lyase beta subunit/heat shock protein HspQ